MTRAAYLVTVTVPPGMSREQCGHEVRVSVNFGKPEVRFVPDTCYHFWRGHCAELCEACVRFYQGRPDGDAVG